jgi:hypothetical protein
MNGADSVHLWSSTVPGAQQTRIFEGDSFKHALLGALEILMKPFQLVIGERVWTRSAETRLIDQ